MIFDELSVKDEYAINLPFGITEHPKKAHNIKELNEENKFYYDVIRDITSDEYFVVLSNADGTETRDRAGAIYIWYKNNHLNKIECAELTTYKNISSSGKGPGDLERMLKYLKRYYDMYRGKVIEILFVEDENFVWTLKEVTRIQNVNNEDTNVIIAEFSKYDISGRHAFNAWTRF